MRLFFRILFDKSIRVGWRKIALMALVAIGPLFLAMWLLSYLTKIGFLR